MVTVTHHTSHSFSYLSSLPLVTDPIAVASNDCARDCLHKDCCAQAFGRNTLSKPHTTLFMIQPGIAKELTSMMQTWLMNEAVCPPAVRHEPDNTLNLLDIDFWLWYRKVTPKGMACAFKIRFWETFSNPRTYDILTDNQYKLPTAMMAVCG